MQQDNNPSFMKKIIVAILFVLLIVGGGVAYYLYNKGPLDVISSHAVEISAVNLYNSFLSDSTTAGKKYAGKVLEVSGFAEDVSVNQNQETIILLRTSVEGAHINCTLEDKTKVNANKGLIHIKGICSGIGDGDPDLGLAADVYLTRCFVINK